MKNRLGIFLTVISIILLIGCGAPQKVVVRATMPPPVPEIKDQKFVAPEYKNFKYTGKDGTTEKTIDNVSVKVESILSELKEKDYNISIKGPDNQIYEYSVFPMMLVLKITNNTDHIVTLDKTIVRLEDENQREYPMIVTTADNKQELIRRINKAFDNYKQAIEKDCNDYEIIMNGNYKKDYEKTLNAIKEIRSKENQYAEVEGLFLEKRSTGKNSFSYFIGGTVQCPIDGIFYHNFSPDNFIKECRNKIEEKVKNIVVYKAEAEKKISEEIPDQMKGVITSGVYPRIDILPGRTARVIAPFAKHSENENINNIRVGVYDLPTKVDQTANPIKRANFNFELVAIESK